MRSLALQEIHNFVGRMGNSQSCNAGVIFVDLFHGNEVYALRSLLIAAYLRKLTGRCVVGLTGKPGVVARSCGNYEESLLVELARAFDVNEVLHFTSINDSAEQEARSFFDALNEELINNQSPGDLRRILCHSRDPKHSMPLGRLVYETTIRAELCATVMQIDETVMRWGAEIISLANWFKMCLASYKYCAPSCLSFVTGHIDFSPWAVIADLVRQAGGELFYFSNETAFSVYRIASPWNPDAPLSAVVADLEAEWFSCAVLPKSLDLLPESRRFHDTEWRYRAFKTWTACNQPDSPPGVAVAASRACKAALQWDPTCPVNVVLCQALADQPVVGSQVFVDRSEWFTYTVEFAAAHPERNWIIKTHPRDAAYDMSGTSERLRARFCHLTHMCFVYDDTPLDLMLALGDVAVTMTGSPGVSFAAAGKPVITVGKARYTTCGFTLSPQSLDEYREMLLKPPRLLSKPQDAQEKAMLYKWMSSYGGVHFSNLLPNDLATPLTDADWRAMGLRFNFSTQCDDDLFASLKKLCAERKGRVEPSRIQYYVRDVSSEARCANRQRTPWVLNQVHSMEQASHQAIIFTGFHRAEAWGVWTRDDVAVVGMLLDKHYAGRRVGIRIDFGEAFTQGQTRVATHDGVVWSGAAKETVVVQSDVLVAEDEEQPFVLFAIYHPARTSPTADGSTDRRRLGVGLKAIGLYEIDCESAPTTIA